MSFYDLVHLVIFMLICSNYIHWENNPILFNLHHDEDTEILLCCKINYKRMKIMKKSYD